MLVRAIEKGYCDVIRMPGDEFEYSGSKLGSWMEKVEVKKPTPRKTKQKD